MTKTVLNSQSADVRDQVKVWDIPISELVIGDGETRKTLDQATLEELAASIAQIGVSEPLTVRRLEAPEGWNDGRRFEIVAGQRRFEASKLAGKTHCPCIVRELSDAEAADWAVISNLQREDLDPLEEALAFNVLLCAPGATVESVAAKLAKEPSYVGRRLKLLDVVEPVRAALRAGAVEVGHALELARLSAEDQVRFLSSLRVGFDLDVQAVIDSGEDIEQQWSATPVSVAALRRDIVRKTRVNLADAPFPLVDPALEPFDCQACPKRSGNAQLLFDDCGQDQCTDRGCYDSKTSQWIEHLIKEYGTKPTLHRLTRNYTNDKKVLGAHGLILVDLSESCESVESGIWIDGQTRGQTQLFCRNQKCKKHYPASGSRSSEPKKSPEAKKKLEAEKAVQASAIKEEEAYRRRLFEAIGKTPRNVLEPIGKRLIVGILVEDFLQAGDDNTLQEVAHVTGIALAALTDEEKLRPVLMDMSYGSIALALLLMQSAHELEAHPWNMREGRKLGLETLALQVGLDPQDYRDAVPKNKPEPKAAKPATKKAETAKTPAPKKAVPAKKKVAAKLSAADRKRIADAQRKRWATPQKAAKKATKKAPAKKAKGGS